MLDTKSNRSTLRQNQSQTAEHIASEKGDGLFTEMFPTPNYQGRGTRQGSKEALQRDPTLTLSPPQLSHITQPSLNDDTKILTETDTETFFRCQISETETEPFFRDQIF